MKLRKQSPPSPPDSDHVAYYVDLQGQPKVMDSASVVSTASHGGEPVSLIESIDPTIESNTVRVYSKDVSAVSELFARNSAGDITQITSGGALNAIGGGAFFDGADFVGKAEFEETVAVGASPQVSLGFSINPDSGVFVMYYYLIEYISLESGFGYGNDMICGYVVYSDAPGTPADRFLGFLQANYQVTPPPAGPVAVAVASVSPTGDVIIALDGTGLTSQGWISGVVSMAGPFNIPFAVA